MVENAGGDLTSVVTPAQYSNSAVVTAGKLPLPRDTTLNTF